MLNLCGIVVAILKMAIGRHFSMSGHHYVPTYQILMISMLNFCGIVVAILKMATSRNFSMLGHHYLPTYKIFMISDNVEFLPPIFYVVFWQPFKKMADISKILKTQNCSSNGDLLLCQILFLYHYPFRSYQH